MAICQHTTLIICQMQGQVRTCCNERKMISPKGPSLVWSAQLILDLVAKFLPGHFKGYPQAYRGVRQSYPRHVTTASYRVLISPVCAVTVLEKVDQSSSITNRKFCVISKPRRDVLAHLIRIQTSDVNPRYARFSWLGTLKLLRGNLTRPCEVQGKQEGARAPFGKSDQRLLNIHSGTALRSE